MEHTVWYLDFQNYSEEQLLDGLYLETAEWDRYQKSKSAKSRKGFLAGRYLLRSVLQEHLNCTKETLVLEYGKAGKPQLVNFPHCHFGLSHSHGLSILTIASFPIGLDLEIIRDAKRYAEVQNRFLPKELAIENDYDFDRNFFASWTKFEAFVKLTGEGVFSDYPGNCQSSFASFNLTIPSTSLREYIIALGCYSADDQNPSLKLQARALA